MNGLFMSASATLKTEELANAAISTAYSSIPALIAARLSENPDAPALVQAGRTVSFAELDHLASRVAASLRSVGVQTDDPVGVYFERIRSSRAGNLESWSGLPAH